MTYPNTLIFMDFPSDDPEASATFYHEVFGWEVEPRPAGVFHRIVPGQNFLVDGEQGPTGNLHMGIYNVNNARPHPDPAGTAPRELSRDGRTVRVWVLVSDDDNADAIMDRAIAHGATELPANAPPIIPATRHVDLARELVARGYRQLVTIAASHWPAGRGRGGAAPAEVEHHEVAYGLRTIGKGSKVVLWSVRADAGQSVPSLAGILAGADWQEREQWDLVGVHFAGHPDLRRLMLPDDWEGHPLRKDEAANAPRPPWR